MSFKSTHGPVPITIESCARARELGVDRLALRAETLVLGSQTKGGLERIVAGVFHDGRMLCAHRGVVVEDGEDWAAYKCTKWLDLAELAPTGGELPGHVGPFATSQKRVSKNGNDYYFRNYRHCSHMVLLVDGGKEIICTECREK